MCNCNHSQPPEKTPQQNIIKRLWETSQFTEKKVTVKKINKL